MATKSPIAPSTESSPQTEAYAKADPVSGIDLSDFAPEPFTQTVKQEEEGWFDSFWGDDDKEGEYSDPLPQDPEYDAMWRRAEKENLFDTKVSLSETYSNRPLDIDKFRKESELVPVEAPSGVAAGINVAADTVMSGIQSVAETEAAQAVYKNPAVQWILNAGGAVLPNLEYFDVLRSEAWTGSYKVSSFLPDTDNIFGSALSDLTGHGFVAVNDLLESDAFRLISPYASDKRTEEEQENFDEALKDLGKAMYSAFADEKLLTKARETEGYFINRPELDLGVFKLLEGAHATGQDFVDIAYPIDVMRRLKENTPKDLTSTQYQMLSMLSDPLSRSVFALGMEVIIDPLTFTGPAGKSVQAAYKGSKYILGKNGARAAAILEQYGGGVGSARHYRTEALKAIVGTTEDAAQARQMILDVADTATEQANANLIKAKRFDRLANMASDQASLSKAVLALQKELSKEVRQLEKSAASIANKEDILSVQRYKAHNKKIAQIKADIDDLSRSPDPRKVQKYLAAMRENKKTLAAIDTANASELESFKQLADMSEKAGAGVVTPTSKLPMFGTWHIPFTDQTYTAFKSSQLESVAPQTNQALGGNSFLATMVGKVGDFNTSIESKIQKALDDGVPPHQYLNNGERLIDAAKAIGVDLTVAPKMVKDGMKEAGVVLSDSAAARWALTATDWFANSLASRKYQAFTAWREASIEANTHGKKGGVFYRLSQNTNRIVRLRRLRPDLWDNYQNSVSNYLNKVELLKAESVQQINLVYHLAGGVDGSGGALAEWRETIRTVDNPRISQEIVDLQSELSDVSKLSRQEIDEKRRLLRNNLEQLSENNRVLSDEYTVNDLINEVAYRIESGSGVIEDNPWLKAVSGRWLEIRKDLATELNVPLEDINQALVAMARFFSGDKEAADEIYRRLQLVQQTLKGRKYEPSDEAISMSSLISASNVRLKGRIKLLNSVSEKKLAEIIYKTLDIAEGRPFGDEVAQAIDDALLKLLKGDEDLKNDILTYAAGIYGKDPEKSLLMFAMEVSGDLDIIAEQVTAGKVLQKSELSLVQRPGPHPLRWDRHPEIKDVDAEMSITEFVNFIKDKEVEYAAIYDTRDGRQLAAAVGTKDEVNLVDNIDQVALREVISSGNFIIVHNHPKGLGQAKENKFFSNMSDKQLVDYHSNMVFGWNDLKVDMALNVKTSIVANPDGTIWVAKRPKQGWKNAPPESVTNLAFRVQHINQKMDPLEPMIRQSYDGMRDHMLSLIERMEENLALLNKEDPNYKQLLRLNRKRWTDYILNSVQERGNLYGALTYAQISGSKPYRQVSPGRYAGKPPISVPESGTVATVERNILRNRIKQAIKDQKLDTQTALYEIKTFRTGVRQDAPVTALGKEAGKQVKRGHVDFRNKVEDFVVEHYIDDIATVEDVEELAAPWVDDLIDWMDTEYPNGEIIVSRADGTRISRTAEEWLNSQREEFDIPESITKDHINKLLSRWVNMFTDEADAMSRLEVLTKAEKILGAPRELSPIRPSKIRKEAKALRKARVSDVLKNLIEGSADAEQATKRVREAFDELLVVPDDPIFAAMKDKMASTLADYAFNKNYGVTPAIDKSLKAGKKLLQSEHDALVRELNEKIPQLKIPDSTAGDDIPKLKDWELRVWDEFKGITSNLSPEEMMKVAFAALADSPTIINAKTVGKDHYNDLKSRYKALVGRRMGELPEELKGVKEAFQGLIKHYEDLYIEHGMTFMKSPEEMLRFWGVVDYVPHTKLTSQDVIDGYTNSVITKSQFREYASSLDDAFSSKMDQRKKRLISGTMKEINALTSAKPAEFGIEPVTLLARYYNASKAISTQEFMYALLAGGVLKPIGSKTVYDDYLETLANKYKVIPENEIDKTAATRIEQLLSGRITTSEQSKLNEFKGSLERVDSARRAADRGYVPLFQRASKDLSNDTLINGNTQAWENAGLKSDEISALVAEVQDFPRKVREDKFAKFSRDSVALRNADEIISVLGTIKAKNFSDKKPLFDVLSAVEAKKRQLTGELANRMASNGKTPEQILNAKKVQESSIESKAWDAVAADMNDLMKSISGIKGELKHRVRGGEALKNFYAQDAQLWNLYIPETVKQSMEDLFVFNEKSSWPIEFLRKFNNFYKLRLTVIAAAFHARNFISNQFTNMLDLGAGALNPTVQFEASRLSALSSIYDRYGSLENARKIYGMKRGVNESTFAFKRRKAQLKFLDSLDPLGSTYNLGDGIPYTADEALKILQERNVLSGNMQQFVDIGDFESNLAEIYSSAGLLSKLDKNLKWVSAAEDGLIMGVPAIMTGYMLPIGLPKSLGRGIGRMTENQARITNFIGNVRKTKSYDKAGEHANKFLFNYSDLTATQRDWMRLLVPFFTWTQKNVALQMEMMRKSPYFYSNFNKLLIHQGPELVEQYNAEISNTPYVPKYGSSRHSLAFRDYHARNYIRFPVPGRPGFYVEGLGLPQEAFFDQMTMISDIKPSNLNRFDNKKRALRIAGQSHFLLKMLGESFSNYHLFYDQPISDLTSGRFASQVIAAFRKVPGVGDGIADAVTNVSGFVPAQPFSNKDGWNGDMYIEGVPNYVLMNMPWSRVLKDASAASMMYNTTYIDRMPEELRKQYSQMNVDPLSDSWKLLDAISGIRITADNEAARKRRVDYDIKQREDEMFRRAGVTKQFDIQTLEDQ